MDFSFGVELIIEAARLIVIKKYCDLFFEKKKQGHLSWLAYIIAYIITTGAYLCAQSLILNLIVTFVGICIITVRYSGRVKRKLFFSVIILGISVALDIIASFIISKSPDVENYDVMGAFISVGLFLISCVVARRVVEKNPNDIIPRYWIYMLLIIVASIVAMAVISLENHISRTSIITLCITLLFVNYVVYFLYNAMIEKYHLDRENYMLKEQMNVYENQIRINLENDKKTRALRHDMKHHLGEISYLAKEGRSKEIVKYVSEMKDFIKNKDNVVSTGNAAVDGILNYKIEKAIAENIQINSKITIPDETELSSFDMNIIFGNLIDNAIEAAGETANPVINIDVEYKKECLFIDVSNSFHQTPKFKRDGLPITTKRDKEEHGFGVENIKRIVEKYDGEMEFSVTDTMFKVYIVMFMG